MNPSAATVQGIRPQTQAASPRHRCRQRAVHQGQLASATPAAAVLHGRLPRPHQHWLRANPDEADAGFGDAAYGFGAGLFFIGYFLFEVPSNLLEKIGTRKTLMRIMVVWGVIATAMAWVSTPMQFYVARFLLGAFEAGFSPASSSTSPTGTPRPAAAG